MKRAALAALALAGVGLGAWWYMRSNNVRAFLALIRLVDSGDDYSVIAGGDHFSDFSEHPFILDPNRHKPLGTTASGAYQMIRKTWRLARDGAQLADFYPGSQDTAAAWLLKFKVPGQDAVMPEGTGNYELVEAGRFNEAIERLRPEWEAFDKMARGRYHVSLAQAREFLAGRGASVA